MLIAMNLTAKDRLFRLVFLLLPPFAGLLLRGYVFWLDPLFSRDAIFYLQLARQAATAPVEFDCPLLISLLAMGIQWGGQPGTVGIILSLAIGTLVIPAGMWLVHELFDNRQYTFWGGLLLAVNPGLIRLSVEIQRENPYLLFHTLFLVFIWRIDRNRRISDSCAAAVTMVLGVFSRIEMLELLPFSIAWLAFQAWESKEYRPMLKCVSCLLVGFAIGYFLFGLLLPGIDFLKSVMMQGHEMRIYMDHLFPLAMK